MGYTYKKELEVKRNAVFQKIAPLFPQLKVGAELDKVGGGVDNENVEIVKPTKIVVKDPAPPKPSMLPSANPTMSSKAQPVKTAAQIGLTKVQVPPVHGGAPP